MKERFLTSIVLAPLVLAALFASSTWPLTVLATIVSVIATYEVGRLQRSLVPKPLAAVGGLLGFVGAVAACGRLPSLHLTQQVWAWALLALWLTGICAMCVRNENVVASVLKPWGLFWSVAPIVGILWLHVLVASQDVWQIKTPALLAILPVWAGDIAAIFAGRAFGKHLLAPKISPQKTWEGSIANLVASVALALPLATWMGFSVATGLLIGLSCGIMGQVGDLFESGLKRQVGIKDSGNVLPGHGGILDRIDSLLFAIPSVILILLLTHGR